MELNSNTIHLYFLYPEDIVDPDLLDQYRSLLSAAELAQMSRFYFARHQNQYLLTRALVRTSLSAYFQIEPAEWEFGKNGYGKPEISYPDSDLPIRFNLSHSNGLVMCGITRDHDIGVDVEDVERSTRAAIAGLSSYFSATEIMALDHLPAAQQKLRFFDYWTLKESYIKARGMGLAIPLGQFSFHFENDTLTGFSVHPELDDDANQWQFWRIAMTSRYRVGLAIRSASRNLQISAFNSVPLHATEPIPLDFLQVRSR